MDATARAYREACYTDDTDDEHSYYYSDGSPTSAWGFDSDADIDGQIYLAPTHELMISQMEANASKVSTPTHELMISQMEANASKCEPLQPDAEETSLFARFVRRADEEFYRTFPAARQSQVSVDGSEYESSSTTYLPSPMSPTSPPSLARALDEPASASQAYTSLPEQLSDLNYDYDVDIPSHLAIAPNPGSILIPERHGMEYGSSSRPIGFSHEAIYASTVNQSPLTAQSNSTAFAPVYAEPIPPHMIVPSQQPIAENRNRQSYPSLPSGGMHGPYQAPEPQHHHPWLDDNPACQEYTTMPTSSSQPSSSTSHSHEVHDRWRYEIVDSAIGQMSSWVPDHPPTDALPNSQRPSSHEERLARRRMNQARSYSQSSSSSYTYSSSPPATMTSYSQPSSFANSETSLGMMLNRSRSLEKKALACYFCRGRKIACGGPVEGSSTHTCHQCQRRSLTCVYPTENRRGIRRKPLASDPSAPKVILQAAPKKKH